MPITCHSWQDNGKNSHFSWNFDLFLTFFKDCDHIYVPNGPIWGSTERPYIGDVVMSLFLLWGRPVITGDGQKMVHFGPKTAKHGRLVNAPKWSKRVQKGSKGTKMVNLSIFDHLGPFWSHLDPFGPFQTRIDILLRSTSVKPYFVHLGQKIIFV